MTVNFQMLGNAALMWICLSALAAIAVGVVGAWLYRSARSVAAWVWRSRSWFEKGVLIGLLSFCVVFGSEKTRSGGALGDRALPSVTVEEIAQGWRIESVVTNDAVSYVMPTNGVEVVFGCDADGDGILSWTEEAMPVGYDCGEWKVVNLVTGDKFTCDGVLGRAALDWKLRLNANRSPRSLAATVNGQPTFTQLATPPPFVFDPTWNAAKIIR